MLNILNIEEIQESQFYIPKLIDLYEQKNPIFINEVRAWLNKLEQILKSNKISEVGSIASFRGLIISAEKGTIIEKNISFQGQPTKRKIQEVTAIYSIRQIDIIISKLIQKDVERIYEAEKIIRQIISYAFSKNIIPDIPIENKTDVLKSLWKSLSSNTELSAGIVNVESLITLIDILILLDRVLITIN